MLIEQGQKLHKAEKMEPKSESHCIYCPKSLSSDVWAIFSIGRCFINWTKFSVVIPKWQSHPKAISMASALQLADYVCIVRGPQMQ